MGTPSGRWRQVVREVGLTLVTAGVVVLLFVAYELVGTNFAEQHSQARLAKEFHRSLSGLTAGRQSAGHGGGGAKTGGAKTGGAKTGAKTAGNGGKSQAAKEKKAKSVTALPIVPPGGALDHLQVPAIGVDRYVVQGVDEADLQMGPGHYPGTPLPGQKGNVAIAGHRTTFGAPFFELNALAPGDLVYLTDTDGDTWVYRVQRQWVVSPGDVAVVAPTPGAELTLTTCNPRFEATSRLVVRAGLWERYGPGTRLPVPLPDRAASAVTAPSTPVSTLPPAPPSTTVPAGTQTSPPGGDNPVVGQPHKRADGAAKSASRGAAKTTSNAGAGSGGAWAGASLWGALALAGWVATRLLAGYRRRWGRVAVLLGGAVVCMVPLWFSFGNVVNLLPSNI